MARASILTRCLYDRRRRARKASNPYGFIRQRAPHSTTPSTAAPPADLDYNEDEHLEEEHQKCRSDETAFSVLFSPVRGGPGFTPGFEPSTCGLHGSRPCTLRLVQRGHDNPDDRGNRNRDRMSSSDIQFRGDGIPQRTPSTTTSELRISEDVPTPSGARRAFGRIFRASSARSVGKKWTPTTPGGEAEVRRLDSAAQTPSGERPGYGYAVLGCRSSVGFPSNGDFRAVEPSLAGGRGCAKHGLSAYCVRDGQSAIDMDGMPANEINPDVLQSCTLCQADMCLPRLSLLNSYKKELGSVRY